MACHINKPPNPALRTRHIVQVVDGEAHILSITKGSAASRVGSTLLVGDRIMAIDGQPLPALGEGPAGTSEIHKRVVEAHGATISITGLHPPTHGASPARQLSSAGKEYTVALMRDVGTPGALKRDEAKSGALLAQEARHPSSSLPKCSISIVWQTPICIRGGVLARPPAVQRRNTRTRKSPFYFSSEGWWMS